MKAIDFNTFDSAVVNHPYFAGAGPVNEKLLDPRVVVRKAALPGEEFNPAFDQKDWAYPQGTGRVRALQLDVVDDTPTLVPYIVTEAIASIYNFVTNSNTQGNVPFMPKPLVPLTGKQAIVKVRVIAGLIVEDQWWVIQDYSIAPPTSDAASGGGQPGYGFNANDRRLLTALAALNGIK